MKHFEDKNAAQWIADTAATLGTKSAPHHTLAVTPYTQSVVADGYRATLSAVDGYEQSAYVSHAYVSHFDDDYVEDDDDDCHNSDDLIIISPFASPKAAHRLGGYRVQPYHATRNWLIRRTPMDCPAGANPRLVGLELEVYNGTDIKDDWITQDPDTGRFMPSCRSGGKVTTYAVIETDGSLASGGIEIITRPGPLAAHVAPLHVLCRTAGLRYTDQENEAQRWDYNARYYINGNPYGLVPHGQDRAESKRVSLPAVRTPRANGMHINVSMAGLDGKQVSLYKTFWRIFMATCFGTEQNMRVWADWARRPPGEYCASGSTADYGSVTAGYSDDLDKSLGKVRQRSNGSNDDDNECTVYEARCFRGTLDFDFIMSRAAAMVAVADVVAAIDVTSSNKVTQNHGIVGYVSFAGAVATAAARECQSIDGKSMLNDIARMFARASTEITDIKTRHAASAAQ